MFLSLHNTKDYTFRASRSIGVLGVWRVFRDSCFPGYGQFWWIWDFDESYVVGFLKVVGPGLIVLDLLPSTLCLQNSVACEKRLGTCWSPHLHLRVSPKGTSSEVACAF